jgi:hypothetical protein
MLVTELVGCCRGLLVVSRITIRRMLRKFVEGFRKNSSESND